MTITAKKFWEFHVNNPMVWIRFCQFTNELRANGHSHYSPIAIYALIRWKTDVSETPDRGFKLSNNYVTWHAHLYNLVFHTDFFREHCVKDFTPIMGKIHSSLMGGA